MTSVSVPGKFPRQKVRAYTRRYLHRLAEARRREEREVAKAARLSRQAMYGRLAKDLAPFRGCDPERTLALLGEEA